MNYADLTRRQEFLVFLVNYEVSRVRWSLLYLKFEIQYKTRKVSQTNNIIFYGMYTNFQIQCHKLLGR